MIDPIALEERLKVARELRAEAIARRQRAGGDPRARTIPALLPAPPGAPGADAGVPAAPPAQALRRAASPGPLRRGARADRVAHPLVALLALALSIPMALSHGVRREEPVPTEAPVTVAAVEPPAPSPVRPPPAPPIETPPAAPGSLAQPAEFIPAAGGALPRPAPPAAAAPDVEPAAATGAEPPAEPVSAPPAPRPERILVNAPAGVAPDAIDAALAALQATGFAEVARQPTRLTISTSTVRYYNAEDAAAAAEIATLIAPFLPGGAAEARDFTDAPSRGAPGHLEVWVAGASPAAPRSATAAPAPAPVIEAAEIQRLINRVRGEPVIENFGRGVSDAARGLESGAERVARQIDEALGGAVRALEGRP